MSTCTTMTSKNKLLIAVAIFLVLLIAAVAVISVFHVVGYYKTSEQLETFALGVPSSITIESYDFEYTEKVTVVKDDAYYARTVYMLDESFASVEEFFELREEVSDLNLEYSTVMKLEYDSPVMIKFTTPNRTLELEANAVHIVTDGDDKDKIIVFTEEKEYIFEKLELSNELQAYIQELLLNLDAEWEF